MGLLEWFGFDGRGAGYQISHVGRKNGEFWMSGCGSEEEIDELVLGESGEVCTFLSMLVHLSRAWASSFWWWRAIPRLWIDCRQRRDPVSLLLRSALTAYRVRITTPSPAR